MLELFERGGIMMYPLALASLIALAFIIERALLLRKRKILIPEIISVVSNFSTLKDIDLAKTICEKYEGPLPNVIKLGLQNYGLPKNEIREILEDQGRQEIRKLGRGLAVLETIAVISPLMGLLGTVLGMVRVFEVIKDQGIGQTAALSGGISEALLTTVTGLFIGIPVLIAYNYYVTKSESLVLDIEKYTNSLVQKINQIHISDSVQDK
ncbi:MAG: MotA/TolQ/ExbB proton channel family protein [Calditrichaceae bacterium]|nr:MotA/TolQ/ExbB proton channel family protein [Calditrichaceae bacterium]MBN2708300.1 MotA/TolQ/ExbB proton channel family protein [Calditrichaceae bacterium]RQV91942.1 MAG: MotA/TolQ/ExbB proton channel family protein [Calditrichota bacterium]